MSLNAAALKILAAKGLSANDLVELAEALENGTPRTSGAVRQARYRENKKAQSVTSDVTNDVTSDVTLPPKKISNPQPVSDETVLATKSKSGRGTRLADDFEPPEDWLEWAMRKRGWSRTDAVEECETFARYWQAKPGREALKRDWPKTWQNWAVNSRRTNGKGTDPPSYLEQYREEQSRIAVGARQ